MTRSDMTAGASIGANPLLSLGQGCKGNLACAASISARLCEPRSDVLPWIAKCRHLLSAEDVTSKG